ncbi:MAG: FmdE family protein [Euryarchaeota archaeon]|nr:FmdE family protein [Euryarchaeota archaeon]
MSKTIASALVILLFTAGVAMAEGIVEDYPELEAVSDFGGDLTIMHLLGYRAANMSMEQLSFEKGDPNVLALTRAGRATAVGGHSTEQCIDAVIATSGCTMGNKNLIIIHSCSEKPLWFVFCNQNTMEATYLRADKGVLADYLGRESTTTDKDALYKEFMEDDAVFEFSSKYNVDANDLIADPTPWNNMLGEIGPTDAMSIVYVANPLARFSPSGLIAGLEMHDHICPAVLCGYFFTEMVMEELPLQSPSDKYVAISTPPWCKDDAMTPLLGITNSVRMVSADISEDMKQQLPSPPYGGGGGHGIGGTVIRWNKTTNSGDGIFMSFNKLEAINLSDSGYLTASSPAQRGIEVLKIICWMTENPDEARKVHQVEKRFKVNEEELNQLFTTGENPLEILGILPEADSETADVAEVADDSGAHTLNASSLSLPVVKLPDIDVDILPVASACDLVLSTDPNFLYFPSPPPETEASGDIVTDYPMLESLADFSTRGSPDNISIMNMLGFKACKVGMGLMKFEKNDPNMMVFTNAGYVASIDGKSTEQCVDAVIDESGCTIGKNNLLRPRTSVDSRVWFAFLNTSSMDCVSLWVNKDVIGDYLAREEAENQYDLMREFVQVRGDVVFTTYKLNVDKDELLNDPEQWDAIESHNGKKNAWMLAWGGNVLAKHPTPEFAAILEEHTHICAGTLVGYHMVDRIRSELPTMGGRECAVTQGGDTLISVVPDCRNDAITALLDTTPGRKGYFSTKLSGEQIDELSPDAKDATTIYIAWNKVEQHGEGIVLGFDTEKARELSGADYENEPFWLCRLKCVTWMADHPDECKDLVKVIHRFEVNDFSELQKLQSVNVNPLAELGLTGESFATTGTGEEPAGAEAAATPFTPAAACMAIVLAAALLFSRRR